MKSSSAHQPPHGVPVLTEVVVLAEREQHIDDEYPPFEADPAYADTAPAPLIEEVVLSPVPAPEPEPVAAYSRDAIEEPPASVLDEEALTEKVLCDLDRQLDLMFEHRVRETLSPLLARLTDTLVREMRNQLASSLREMVTRAVSTELDRLHRR